MDCYAEFDLDLPVGPLPVNILSLETSVCSPADIAFPIGFEPQFS